MSAINIDLIYGNRYYTTKADKQAEPENPNAARDSGSANLSEPGKRAAHASENCGQKADIPQALPL